MWLLPLLLFAAPNLIAEDNVIARHAAAAAAAMRSGDYASAEKHNREVIKLAPEIAEAQTNLGLSCFLQKKYDAAIQAFDAGLKHKPEMANAWLFLGIAHFNLNRTSHALPALKRYTTMQPGDFQGHYFLGLTLLAREQHREAAAALAVATRIDPKNVDALYHLAQSYLGEAKENPAARDALGRSYQATVKQMAGIEPDSFRIAQLRAGYYEAIGKKAEAMRELENLLQRDPKVRGLHYTLGCLYMEARDYDKAFEQFQAELRLDAPYPRTYLQLGHVFIAKEKPAEALQFLEKAVKMEPDAGSVVWVDMGRAYNMMEQPEKAAEAFSKAIGLGERKAPVYYQLGMALRKAGDAERAKEALKISEQLRREERQTPQ